ncbi:MAG: T9SS type A sorting domain-containing protein [Chitinophagales bacterium]
MLSLLTFSTAIVNAQNNVGVQVQQVQGNEYSFTVNYPEYDSKDLIFWIMPNGDWKYGHQVNGHFESGAYQFGTAYILKKNDTDFGIVSHPIPPFSVSSPSNGQNLNGNTHSLKLSSSWSASKDHWVYTILTVTNTSSQTIDNGTLSLSYQNNVGYNFNTANTIIPYNWANTAATITNGNLNTLNWTFNDLSPGEQKYIYVAFDVANNAQHMAQLTASINSNEITTSKPLTLETKNYPHDPNFARINAHYGSEYGEYEYCSQYSEGMSYTIGFQNEGAASAMDIEVEIDIEEEFYQMNTLALAESSHPEVISSFTYDNTTGKIIVYFKGINLPGLNQTDKKISFQETTGYVSFEISTKCAALQENLPTDAGIVFIAKDGTNMPVIYTNTVHAIMGEITSFCTSCTISSEEEDQGNKRNLGNENTLNSVSLSPNPCSDFLTINYNLPSEIQAVEINILDIAGKQRKNLLHTSLTKGTHQMRVDVSDLESGIYLVNIQVGGKNESYKLVKW